MKKVRYLAEFKAEAVTQVTERGHDVVEVSSRLGVLDKGLYRQNQAKYIAWMLQCALWKQSHKKNIVHRHCIN